MDLLMDINTCNIIINIDEDIRWQHHRIIVNFRDSGSCRRRRFLYQKLFAQLILHSGSPIR